MSNQILQNAQTDRLVTKDQDLRGRRTRNASDAQFNQDYVTLSQLKVAVAGISNQTTASTPGTSGGRVFSLFRDGTLGIQSDCCQRVFILTSFTPSTVRCDVKQASAGFDIIVKIYQSAVLWQTITIPLGTTTGAATPVPGLSSGNYLRVDITQVGSPTTPGSDLTVTIA